MTIATICAALILWMAAAIRWVRFRNTAGQRALTHSMVALACSATLFIPVVNQWIDSKAEFPQFGTALLFASGAFAALAMTGAIRFMELPERQAQTGAFLRRCVVALSVLGIAFTLFIGQPSVTVSSSWADQTAMIVFWTLWLGFVVFSCGWMTLRIFERSRRMQQSRVRSGLRVLGLASICGLIYGLTKAVLVIAGIAGVNSMPVLVIISQAAVIVMFIAAAVASLLAALPATKHAQRARDARSIELIHPLWQKLRVVDPGLQLPHHDPELDLYRMVVECRDWIRQLRFGLPANAWEEALSAARAQNLNPAVSTATAGWIEAGLIAQERGIQVKPASEAPPTASDLDQEIDFLMAVAQVPAPSAATIAAAVAVPQQALDTDTAQRPEHQP